MKLQVKELETKEQMLLHLSLMQQMYAHLDEENYGKMLDQMIPNNYGQIGVFLDEKCIGISGFWIHTKLWVGKILEMDNVLVDETHRGAGAGKLLSDFLTKKAKQENCQAMVLDAFVGNYKAHKFYYNQGFVAKGYHFVKRLHE